MKEPMARVECAGGFGPFVPFSELPRSVLIQIANGDNTQNLTDPDETHVPDFNAIYAATLVRERA